MDSSGFEPEASRMPSGRSSADLRAPQDLTLQHRRANKSYWKLKNKNRAPPIRRPVLLTRNGETTLEPVRTSRRHDHPAAYDEERETGSEIWVFQYSASARWTIADAFSPESISLQYAYEETFTAINGIVVSPTPPHKIHILFKPQAHTQPPHLEKNHPTPQK